MINIVAIASLRDLPQMASYGLSLIFFYVLVALVFFIPVSLVAAELATAWPERGGVYVWVREAFGKRWGFPGHIPAMVRGRVLVSRGADLRSGIARVCRCTRTLHCVGGEQVLHRWRGPGCLLVLRLPQFLRSLQLRSDLHRWSLRGDIHPGNRADRAGGNRTGRWHSVQAP